MTATAHYQEQPLNRICSRNDNVAKPNQLSLFGINSSLQWPMLDGSRSANKQPSSDLCPPCTDRARPLPHLQNSEIPRNRQPCGAKGLGDRAVSSSNRREKSLEQKKLAGLDEVARDDPIEVDSACKSRCIKLNFMVPRYLIPLDEL
jgi:hypothetical protein